MTGRLVLRIPIRVTTFDNESNETVDSSTYTKQGQLAKFVQSQTKKYSKRNVTFTAKILYNRKDDYFNEFNFTSLEDFESKLAPCIERPLLKELVKNKVLPKEYVSGL